MTECDKCCCKKKQSRIDMKAVLLAVATVSTWLIYDMCERSMRVVATKDDEPKVFAGIRKAAATRHRSPRREGRMEFALQNDQAKVKVFPQARSANPE